MNTLFERYLIEADPPVNWMDIGHRDTADVELWVYDREWQDYEKRPLEHSWQDHGDIFHRLSVMCDAKGRIDNRKKTISMGIGGHYNDEEVEYLISLLQMDHPGYEIWDLSSSTPKRI